MVRIGRAFKDTIYDHKFAVDSNNSVAVVIDLSILFERHAFQVQLAINDGDQTAELTNNTGSHRTILHVTLVLYARIFSRKTVNLDIDVSICICVDDRRVGVCVIAREDTVPKPELRVVLNDQDSALVHFVVRDVDLLECDKPCPRLQVSECSFIDVNPPERDVIGRHYRRVVLDEKCSAEVSKDLLDR